MVEMFCFVFFFFGKKLTNCIYDKGNFISILFFFGKKPKGYTKV